MPPSPQVTEPWRHSLGRGCRKLAWGAPTLALLVPSSLASGLPRLPGVDGGGAVGATTTSFSGLCRGLGT